MSRTEEDADACDTGSASGPRWASTSAQRAHLRCTLSPCGSTPELFLSGTYLLQSLCHSVGRLASPRSAHEGGSMITGEQSSSGLDALHLTCVNQQVREVRQTDQAWYCWLTFRKRRVQEEEAASTTRPALETTALRHAADACSSEIKVCCVD